VGELESEKARQERRIGQGESNCFALKANSQFFEDVSISFKEKGASFQEKSVGMRRSAEECDGHTLQGDVDG
jgi:hypothetical protein